MGAVITIIVLGLVGVFFKYYMASDRNKQTKLVFHEKIYVANWMRFVAWMGFVMIAGCLLGAYYGDDLNVRQVVVPGALVVIWFPLFALLYYHTLYIVLTDNYIERTSILGKKRIPYDEVIKVESLPQGMFALHSKGGKRVVFEPVFQQSPKIKSYLQDIAYENRSRERQKRRSRG